MEACKHVSRVKRVAGGKTLKIDAKICSGVIEEIVISGDFFAYPEELVDEMEHKLRGRRAGEIREILESYRGLIEFAGVSLEDIAELIMEILAECGRSEERVH